MHSLTNIPEPSGSGPPQQQEPAPYLVPTAAATGPGVDSAVQHEGRRITKPDEPDDQVDSVAFLLILFIAGGLLRIVLGLLGPLQGIDPQRVQRMQQQGRDVLAGDPHDAYPLFDLLAAGTSAVGLPTWVLVLIGSLLTLGAVPAAYLIGQALTGRCVAGILAAAVVAVHPAVLTASNIYAGSGIALGLLTIGLALVCNLDRRALGFAIGGGVMLGLAGLAAPFCWLVGVLAGPVTYKRARKHGMGKAIGYGLCVSLLALAPASAYRATLLGPSTGALFQEWANADPTQDALPATDRLLVTMTQPSLQALGKALHLPLGDAGRLKVSSTAKPSPNAKRDIVADYLADGWLLINAALAGLAAISIGVMLARRRLAETALLGLPLIALAFCTMPPSETLRLPLIALVSVLATGLLATRSVSPIDEATREARRVAKEAKRDEKERARQERSLNKHKGALYAFDTPGQTKPKRQASDKSDKTDKVQGAKEPDLPNGILTQREAPAPPIPSRPI